MGTTKILSSVKTKMLDDIKKALAEKNMSLVDISLNVEIQNIQECVEKRGETCFGVYDNDEKKQICGLFFENSILNRSINKIVWRIKLNDYHRHEQKVLALKTTIEKAVSILRMQIIVNGGSR